jgi:opacity protein-like surface antigen
MFNSLNKNLFSGLLALSGLMSVSLMAFEDECEFYQQNDCCQVSDCCQQSNRLYIGAFGGGLYPDSNKISQVGTAYFPYVIGGDGGGPLAVDARGHTKKKATGFGGVQIGYEWLNSAKYCGCSGINISPAVELEAFFYSHKRNAYLVNPTTRLDAHDFRVSFKSESSVILANFVLSLNNFSNHSFLGKFTPYVGAGIGATHISLKHAKSIQVDPAEDFNHFNSDRSDSSWAFAAQVKAGIRYNVSCRFHIFAEYRYLFVDASNYLLGSTVYDNHVPTSPWNVKLHNINYNAFAIGIQYDL